MERKDLLPKSQSLMIAHLVLLGLGAGLTGYFIYRVIENPQSGVEFALLILSGLLFLYSGVLAVLDALKPRILVQFDDKALYLLKRHGKEVAIRWEDLTLKKPGQGTSVIRRSFMTNGIAVKDKDGIRHGLSPLDDPEEAVKQIEELRDYFISLPHPPETKDSSVSS